MFRAERFPKTQRADAIHRTAQMVRSAMPCRTKRRQTDLDQIAQKITHGNPALLCLTLHLWRDFNGNLHETRLTLSSSEVSRKGSTLCTFFSSLIFLMYENTLLPPIPANRYAECMYEDFKVTDRWTGAELHCRWKANIVAIATRHADAVDIRFDVNGKPMWIAMPCNAWVEQKKRTGKIITDALAAQTAGHYLKSNIEDGADPSREMFTMSTDEVLEHLNAVLNEATEAGGVPTLPLSPFA